MAPSRNRAPIPSPLRRALFLAVLGLALPLQARETWRIDPGPSAGQFRVRLFAMMSITGRFEDVSGRITIDRERGTARVQATIGAGSVALRTPRQTRWARSPEFFDAERHPEIRFTSESLSLDRLASGGVLQGELRVRGVTREVRFEIGPSNCGEARLASCALEVGGAIRRSEFGMSSRRGALSDRVTLKFSVVALPG